MNISNIKLVDMKIISKSISLDSYNYHKKHLYIINPMLPIQMTDKEIEVLI